MRCRVFGVEKTLAIDRIVQYRVNVVKNEGPAGSRQASLNFEFALLDGFGRSAG